MRADDLELLKSLPRSRETWQGGLFRMPLWVTEEAPEPYRPWGGVWISLDSTKAHGGRLRGPGERSTEQVLEAFIEFARDEKLAGFLPQRVEVAGEEATDLMRRALAPFRIAVTRRDRLLPLEAFLESLGQHENQRGDLPGALEPPGMTLERFASFAESARLFFEAAPWRHLVNEDLLRIEGKGIPEELRHGAVMGAAGREFGLLLFQDRELHDAILSEGGPEEIFDTGTRVCVFFGPIYELPLQDSDLFLDHSLPVAGPKAYPWAARFGPARQIRRLGPSLLSQVEAIMRALAATTEAEIDGGRWSRIVPAADGAEQITLTLPDLAEPQERPARRLERRTLGEIFAEIVDLPDRPAPSPESRLERMILERCLRRPERDPASAPLTPLASAQNLCCDTVDVRGRRRVLLARQALEISPDCTEAYLILAEHTGDPEEALRFYGEGVAAGERVLGPARFKDDGAPFWADMATRPFMIALQGLAESCAGAGRLKDAVLHYRRLLRLNPEDSQGARYPLAGLLLRLGDDEALGSLLEQFRKDSEPILLYAAALMEFRRRGDSAESRRVLRRAVKLNARVPDFLLGRSELPPVDPSSYSSGSVEEAVVCAQILVDAWRSRPDALAWLRKVTKGGSK